MMRPAIFVVLLCLVAGGLAAFVQDETPTERPNRGGDQRMKQMGPPGPPSSMVVCKDKIFIFAGSTLYKVDPDSMKVLGELQVLKAPQKMGEGGERDDRDK